MSAREAFVAQARERVLVFDGAFGTQIQSRRLGEADYAGDLGLGADQGGNNDILALTRPDVIADITRAYFAAGADMVSTNTFSANRISQADYGAEDLVPAINREAASIARSLADEFAAADGRPRFVAGAIGPTNKTLSLSPSVEDPGFREIDFDLLSGVYREQAAALIEGGADFILVETIFDTLNAKAALFAIEEAFDARGARLPIMISGTITDASGRTLSGQTAEAFYASVAHSRPLSVGLNCALGASDMRPHVETLSIVADCRVSAHPNAGLPNAFGEYDETPEEMATTLREFASAGLLNLVGGCCGTSPAHIQAIAEAVADLPPRAPR